MEAYTITVVGHFQVNQINLLLRFGRIREKSGCFDWGREWLKFTAVKFENEHTKYLDKRMIIFVRPLFVVNQR